MYLSHTYKQGRILLFYLSLISCPPGTYFKFIIMFILSTNSQTATSQLWPRLKSCQRTPETKLYPSTRIWWVHLQLASSLVRRDHLLEQLLENRINTRSLTISLDVGPHAQSLLARYKWSCEHLGNSPELHRKKWSVSWRALGPQ